MPEQNELPDVSKVEFNLAQRRNVFALDEILNRCLICRNQGRYNEWYYALIDLDAEINYKFSEKETEDIKNLFQRVSLIVLGWERHLNPYSKGLSVPPHINSLTFQELLFLEKSLRKLMGRYGFFGREKLKPGTVVIGGE